MVLVMLTRLIADRYKKPVVPVVPWVSTAHLLHHLLSKTTGVKQNKCIVQYVPSATPELIQGKAVSIQK